MIEFIEFNDSHLWVDVIRITSKILICIHFPPCLFLVRRLGYFWTLIVIGGLLRFPLEGQLDRWVRLPCLLAARKLLSMAAMPVLPLAKKTVMKGIVLIFLIKILVLSTGRAWDDYWLDILCHFEIIALAWRIFWASSFGLEKILQLHVEL